MTKKISISFLWVIVLLLYLENGALGQRMALTRPHSFEEVDRWVTVFEDPKREEWQKPDEVVKALNIKPGDVIADIGAGTGYFTRRFAVAAGPAGKALGLDIEPSMVKYMKDDAQKRGLKNYEARIVKANDPELAPGSVDVIFICDTYHHIEDRIVYLGNLKKALKPDGRVIIVDFYKRESPVGPPLEMKLSEDTVKEEFRQAGYHLTRSPIFLPYQYFLEFEPVEADHL
jgi:ubiquinone/menaquinone biosynthesis C-methylase UbiE